LQLLSKLGDLYTATVQTMISSETSKIIGQAVAGYGPRKRQLREAWLWPIPGFILAVILIITGLDWFYYGYTKYGPVAASLWSQDWLAAGIIVCAITLCLTVWQFYRSRVKISLYQYGIGIKLPGRSLRNYRWEEISGIASATIQEKLWGHIIRTRHRCTLYFSQDSPIILDDRVHKISELATRLKANIYPRLLPRLRLQYISGGQLSFGPIGIQLNYLVMKEKQIPWEQIERITVNSGHFCVEKRTQVSDHTLTHRISIDKIPNLELLFQILQRGLNGIS